MGGHWGGTRCLGKEVKDWGALPPAKTAPPRLPAARAAKKNTSCYLSSCLVASNRLRLNLSAILSAMPCRLVMLLVLCCQCACPCPVA